MIKAVLFDIDNTLYDNTKQVELARRNAIEAMIEAGLKLPAEEALEILVNIVKKHGPNYERHFDTLVEKSRSKARARIVAAGIVAYHNTKVAHLKPFPDTIETLLKLKGRGYRLGIITEGMAIKQWEKIIRLGLQHFFDVVLISRETEGQKSSGKIFKKAAKDMGLKPEECIYVGDKLGRDVLGAKKSGMVSVRILKGKYRDERPRNRDETPEYEIKDLGELLRIDILK
ncbi:MAG: TIGR02253 family HAD-type hydrolase [Candidatus Altiarchaeota archaeon]|nr:TIGR02253 family HAD-type hydrolase [Candidatus Altiarchaeota archaeon]